MKSSILGLSVFLVGLFVASCGGTDTNQGGTTEGGKSGAGGAGAGGAGAGGEIITTGCNPSCTPPQFCSMQNVCIDSGTCLADADCGAGTVCDTMAKMCVPGGDCGAQEAVAEAIPPNVLVVLDRSCSMRDVVTGTLKKWDIAVQAINKMTMDFNSKIRFGLGLFPDIVGGDCGQGQLIIPTAPGNEMSIQMLLTNSLVNTDPYYPNGPCVTNIDTAMQQATTEPAFNDTMRKSYVLLITDGKQAGCSAAGGDNGTTQIITDLYQMRNIPTFVLGFGTGVDPTQMNTFADAGGVPNNDPMTHYYKAEDQASLDAALAAIASQTLGCNFKLDQVPPDPTKLFVFFDNNPTAVPRDGNHVEGWDYDAGNNQVTFYGMACNNLKAGIIKDVDIVFGCGMPTPN